MIESLALAAFGNHIGAKVELAELATSLTAQLGGFIFTSTEEIAEVSKIGETTADFTLAVNGVNLAGDKLLSAFEGKLEDVYPTEFEQSTKLEDVPAVVSDAVIKASEKLLNHWFTSQYSLVQTQSTIQLKPLNKQVQKLTWYHL